MRQGDSSEDRLIARRAVLAQLGGTPETVSKALEYCENHFALQNLPPPPILPLPDEPHLTFWRAHLQQYGSEAFAALQSGLPQFSIPLRAGISKTAAYKAVVHDGLPFQEAAFGGCLTLERPAEIRLVIREHPAGALPVLIIKHRPDFEMLIGALALHHEPGQTNASVNARMISGFLNWERVRGYQAEWIGAHGLAGINSWPKERLRVATDEKWRFYDRLMVICEHPYSNSTASALGLDMNEQRWLETSTVLRLEHEFTHYATYRLYGYMALNLFDETICDWAGMMLALGRFDSRRLLHFLGLESPGQVRPDGRVLTYCQGLDENSLRLICELMRRVAEGLEELTTANYVEKDRVIFWLALTRLNLELIAAEDRQAFFQESYAAAANLLRSRTIATSE
ncbi:MAG TPA: hypothetical protein VGK48_00680 [Terriglobia bacterium]|jgi:hypothetical protein